MKKSIILLFCLLTTFTVFKADAQSNDLRVVFIRHAEKPKVGDNLTCQGLNRALKLPAVLYAKFGIPAFTFVPSIGLGEATKHSRMFQTVMPLAAKYNLVINSAHIEQDSLGIAANIKNKSGTVLVLWEHKGIAPIVRSLGVTQKDLTWPDDDYDTIWIITFKGGKAIFTIDKEGIIPSADCSI
jgi:hypothetical protein